MMWELLMPGSGAMHYHSVVMGQNIKYERIGTAEYQRDSYNISGVHILYKKLKKKYLT